MVSRLASRAGLRFFAVALLLAISQLASTMAQARILLDGRQVAIDYIQAETDIALVYASAGDCPPCWAWKRDDLPKWQALDASRHIAFREVALPSLRDMRWKKKWPADLEHVRNQITRSGAPQFVVLVDGTIVFHVWGSTTWRKSVVPFLRNAVLQQIGRDIIDTHGNSAATFAAAQATTFATAGEDQAAARWLRIAARIKNIQAQESP